MTNQPQIDPALSAHLTELAELAREIGAAGTLVIRGASMVRLFVDIGKGPQLYPLAGVGAEHSETIAIILFPASDGGAAGVEVK